MKCMFRILTATAFALSMAASERISDFGLRRRSESAVVYLDLDCEDSSILAVAPRRCSIDADLFLFATVLNSGGVGACRRGNGATVHNFPRAFAFADVWRGTVSADGRHLDSVSAVWLHPQLRATEQVIMGKDLCRHCLDSPDCDCCVRNTLFHLGAVLGFSVRL